MLTPVQGPLENRSYAELLYHESPSLSILAFLPSTRT